MTSANQHFRLRFGSDVRVFEAPAIMGVLNVTPDSFSDGGRYDTLDSAMRQAQAMTAAGAVMLDIGGESTRPGALPVSVQQELDRVVPVIERLSGNPDVVISIDTSKPEVMRAAVDAGAALINDVWALRRPGALETAAALSVPVCLMHMQGEPGTMQATPRYDDPLKEVSDFLAERAAQCVAAGIAPDAIIIDPGFGFGKRLGHNLTLLNGLNTLCAMGFPLLAGLSRKSMLGEITAKPVTSRVTGSVILAYEAASQGASIVRVHDVDATNDARRILRALREHASDND